MQRTTFDYLIIIIPIAISVISVIISTVNLFLTKKSITLHRNYKWVIISEKSHSELDEFNEKFKMKSVIGSFIAPGQKFSTNISDSFKDDIILTLE